MARFRGTIEGNGAAASKLGTPKSGLITRTNGWQSGVMVEALVSEADKDIFLIYATKGSAADTYSQYIGKVVVRGVGFQFIPA